MFSPEVERIPQDILQLIFSVLDDSDFKNLAQVNRFFNSAAVKGGLPRLGSHNLCLQTFISKCSDIKAIAVLPEDKIAIGLRDGSISIIDYINNTVIKTIDGHSHCHNKIDSGVICLLHLGAGKLAASTYDACVRIYNYETGEYLEKTVGNSVHGHDFLKKIADDSVCSMALLGSNQIALGHKNGYVSILDIDSLEYTQNFRNCNNEVFGLTNLSEDKLASGAMDWIVRIWNYKTGQLIHTLNNENSTYNWVNSVVNLENDRLGSCHLDGFRVWNSKTGECLKTLVAPIAGYNPKFLVSGQKSEIKPAINCIQARKCSKTTVICQYETGTLRQWDYVTGKCLRVFSGNENNAFYTMPTYDPAEENQSKRSLRGTESLSSGTF